MLTLLLPPPSLSPQILSGIYPIAQVREPYSAVGYLAERVSLTEWLQLVHPEAPHPVYKRSPGTKIGDCELYETSGGSGSASHVTRGGEEWTAWDICDGVHYMECNSFCSMCYMLNVYSMGHQKRLLHFQSS